MTDPVTPTYVTATYVIETSLPLERAAEVLAGEQSTGTFVRVLRESDDVRARFAAQVESVEEVPLTDASPLPGTVGDPAHRRRAVLRLRFPLDNFGPSIPNLQAAVAGNLFEIKELAAVKLVDLDLPDAFATRYTVFGHHFAAEHGAVHRLDRQPTMSAHPATPMDESDLAVHLGRQTTLPIGSLPFLTYTSGDAVAAGVRTNGSAAIVLDAVDDTHLAVIGAGLRELADERRPLFVVGSGGLSRAIAHGWGEGGATDPVPRTAEPADRPVLVVSGSLSPQTRRQVDAAARAGWHVQDLPLEVEAAPAAAAEAVAMLRSGRSVVLASHPSDLSAEDALPAVATAAASLALSAVRAGATSRVIVCGGDTSGRVVRLLGVSSLAIAANPMGNVVLLRARADDPAVDGLELVLKGGQVGADDLFVRIADGGDA